MDPQHCHSQTNWHVGSCVLSLVFSLIFNQRYQLGITNQLECKRQLRMYGSQPAMVELCYVSMWMLYQVSSYKVLDLLIICYDVKYDDRCLLFELKFVSRKIIIL
jgi:hypothetical protein